MLLAINYSISGYNLSVFKFVFKCHSGVILQFTC